MYSILQCGGKVFADSQRVFYSFPIVSSSLLFFLHFPLLVNTPDFFSMPSMTRVLNSASHGTSREFEVLLRVRIPAPRRQIRLVRTDRDAKYLKTGSRAYREVVGLIVVYCGHPRDFGVQVC